MSHLPGKSPFIKNLIPGLPERGKIKIGIKGEVKKSAKGNEFQPPKKLDHFIVTTLQRGPDGNFIRDEEIHKIIGDKPVSIPTTLLYNDPVLNFTSRYVCFKGKTLWCSGDGENAYRRGKEGEALINCPCPLSAPDYVGTDMEPKCKMSGRLFVLIRGANVLGGVWKFSTTSYNSIVNIMSQLVMYRQITGGHLAGIPFELTLSPKTAIVPTTGASQTIYIVGISYSGNEKQLQDISYSKLLQDKEHFARMEKIEEEARKLVSAELTEEEKEEILPEMFPEQAASAEGLPYNEKPKLINPNEQINTKTGEITERGNFNLF